MSAAELNQCADVPQAPFAWVLDSMGSSAVKPGPRRLPAAPFVALYSLLAVALTGVMTSAVAEVAARARPANAASDRRVWFLVFMSSWLFRQAHDETEPIVGSTAPLRSKVGF